MNREKLSQAIVRLGALTIDLFAAAVPLTLVMTVSDSAALLSMGGMAFAALFLQRNWGISPGYNFLGVTVRHEKSSRISLKASILRNMTILVPMVIFFEGAMVLFRENGERLGDLLAETRVDCAPGNSGKAIAVTVALTIAGTIAILAFFGHHMNISHPGEF